MRNVENMSGSMGQEFNEVKKHENFGEFIQGLKTDNYSDSELQTIRGALDKISREI